MGLNFLRGYHIIMKNAYAHYHAAKLIAWKKKSYGIASSLLILSAEEAVKAGVTLFLHFDPTIKVTGYKKLFKDHRVKHAKIIEFEHTRAFMIGMIRQMAKPIITYAKSDEEFSIESLQVAQSEGVKAIIAWIQSLIQGNTKLEYHEDWWKQANTEKNRGFYVDLNESTGEWENPQEIPKIQYLKTKSIVEPLLKDISRMERALRTKKARKAYQQIVDKYPGAFDISL
jgi:AbiV family abortive infection protein